MLGLLIMHKSIQTKFILDVIANDAFSFLQVSLIIYSPEAALDFGSERGSEKEQWQT